MHIFKKMSTVPFINPKVSYLDLIHVVRSIRSTWLVYGENTRLLETELVKYLRVSDVIATSSCTSALQLALMLSNVTDGDEVITTPMSWVASTTAIIHQGGIPVFCDIDKSGLIDISRLEQLITPRTRAILFVDLYGQMPNVKTLREIADKYDLYLIEDAAHALEAKYQGERPGSMSDFAAFSFHAAKNITSGQGGALAVRIQSHGETARILRRDGVVNLPDGRRRMLYLGNKFDSTDFQSAMLLHQLKRIQKLQNRRKRIFEYYSTNIDLNFCEFPYINPNATHANHLFVVLTDPSVRDEVRAMMQKRRITTSVHYESIHLEPYFAKNRVRGSENLKESELFGSRVIALPTYPQLSKRKMRRVVKILNESLRIASTQ